MLLVRTVICHAAGRVWDTCSTQAKANLLTATAQSNLTQSHRHSVMNQRGMQGLAY